eukprot:1507108-Rhodomonas_salina.1
MNFWTRSHSAESNALLSVLRESAPGKKDREEPTVRQKREGGTSGHTRCQTGTRFCQEAWVDRVAGSMFSTLIKKPNVILVDSDEGDSPGSRALPMLESPEHAGPGSTTSPQRSPQRMLRRVSSGAEVAQAHRSLNLFPSIA